MNISLEKNELNESQEIDSKVPSFTKNCNSNSSIFIEHNYSITPDKKIGLKSKKKLGKYTQPFEGVKAAHEQDCNEKKKDVVIRNAAGQEPNPK